MGFLATVADIYLEPKPLNPEGPNIMAQHAEVQGSPSVGTDRDVWGLG